MPAKYNILTEQIPARKRPVGKLGIVDWREDCSSCHNCVKRSCIYGFYRDEYDTLRDSSGYLDYIFQCKGCLNCVQECTKNILTCVTNPEFARLGDGYYTPEIISSTWTQAETGKVPVSGGGYGGRFSGPGFDSMWTDMSEIVRPTRDGIHGREYINTGVDLGRKLPHLVFDENGRLTSPAPTLVECPIPLIFDALPERFHRGSVLEAVWGAAAEIGTFAISDGQTNGGTLIPLAQDPADLEHINADDARIVMFVDRKNRPLARAAFKKKHPDKVLGVRLPATTGATERIVDLAKRGLEMTHLVFDAHGREIGVENPRHMRDVLRETHQALVREGVRDEITLMASGGIAMAEHMAKAIICGADLVAIDLPLVIALECRLCGECARNEPCPTSMAEFHPNLGVKRIVNLMAAWRNQLLELLGAMGIREVRRLRGETGRAMFFEDLEAQSFGKLFGKRKDRNGAQ